MVSTRTTTTSRWWLLSHLGARQGRGGLVLGPHHCLPAWGAPLPLPRPRLLPLLPPPLLLALVRPQSEPKPPVVDWLALVPRSFPRRLWVQAVVQGLLQAQVLVLEFGPELGLGLGHREYPLPLEAC